MTNHKSCKAKDPFGQGQGLNPQGQGLKICPRGQLKAKDQGQGQQHWLHVILEWISVIDTQWSI